MPEPQWNKVEVPQGRFIGWGKRGQQVTLDVLDFDATGGSDFNGNQCPQVSGTLVEACDNYRDKGTTKEKIPAGELVTITCGQANLRKGILMADPKRGDLLRLTYADDYETAKGSGKVISVEHAPGAGGGGGGGDSVDEDDL